MGNVPTCTKDEEDGEEVVDCSTSGMAPLTPHLPGVSGTGRSTVR